MDGRSSDKHSRVLDQDDGVHGPHLNCAPQHKQSKRFKHFKHSKKIIVGTEKSKSSRTKVEFFVFSPTDSDFGRQVSNQDPWI